jgi:hypothetical protein
MLIPNLYLKVSLLSKEWKPEGNKKNGGSWGYEPPDEEDIEVCVRSIDLWGMIYINYYNVACQAFFYFFNI